MLRRFLNQPVWVRVLRGLLLAAVVTVITVYTPTPYLLEAPGRAVPASQIVTIRDARTYPSDGQLLMITVLSEKATLLMCIYGLLDPAATLTREGTVKEGEHAQSPPENEQMELSQYLSTRVALEKLGYKVQGKFLGLRIMGIAKISPNIEQLRPGDLIVGLDGRKMVPIEDFKATMELQTPEKRIPALIKRGDETLTVNLGVVEVDGKKRIGAILRPEYSSVELPVKVAFDSGNTSGASGGLIFALEIYDKLSPADLTRGRTIAATGTLDGGGSVGGIEGISFKLIAAERAGATVFLVPRENWNEIENTATSMTVIPVETFQEALDALE